jgi:hypothetical protein
MFKLKKVGICVLLTVFILSFAINLPSADASNTTGTIIKRALINGHYTSPSYIASKADLFVCHYDWGPIVPQIHSIRYDLIVLLYRNLLVISTGSPEWNLAVSNNWILKDAQGNYLYAVGIPSLYLVDKGNPSYQAWVAQWISQYVNLYGFDGVYADCSGYPWVSEATFFSNYHAGLVGPPINPRTGGIYTNEQWKDAEISLANTISSAIGSKILIENGVFSGSSFFRRPYSDILEQSKVDGTVSEGWMLDLNNAKWYSESQWLDAVNFELWIGSTLFPQKTKGTFLAVCQNPAPLDMPYPFLPAGCSQAQYALFVYGSLLLGATNTGSIYLNLGLYTDTDYPQSLFAIDIGNPTDNYYMISGTHVYTRDFTNVKVLVNPTDTAYSVNLGGTYQTIDGTQKTSSITVNSHTAIILKPVNFATTTPRLTVLESPNGRTMAPGTYTYPAIGDYVWLVAHSDAGYTFKCWIIDGVEVPAQYLEEDGDFTYYLHMDRDHTMQAVFKSTQLSVSGVFKSDFETGDFRDWASTYTTSDSSATVYPFSQDSSYSAGFTVPGGQSVSRAYSYYKSMTGMSTATVSMNVFVAAGLPAEPWKALWLVQFISGNGLVLASYGIKDNSVTGKWATYSQDVTSYATSGPTQGTWYRIDAYYSRAVSGETVTLCVNGVEVSHLNLDTSGSGVAGVRCGIGYYDARPSGKVYIDNVLITDY